MTTVTNLTAEELCQEVFSMLVDGCAGIYTAQRLVRNYPRLVMNEEDKAIIDDGPDHEHYCEACDSLDTATIADDNGKVWHIAWREGDLFAVDYDTIEKWEEQTGLNFWDEVGF